MQCYQDIWNCIYLFLQDGEDSGSSVVATQRDNATSCGENFEFVVVKDEPQDVSCGEEDGLTIEITERSV